MTELDLGLRGGCPGRQDGRHGKCEQSFCELHDFLPKIL
jgi:hypothetical protein